MVDITFKQERQRKLILLADDSQTVTQMVACVLKAAGFRFQYFENGKELLNHLRNNPNSANSATIILDVAIPVMGGYEACTYIKREFPDVGASILFFTTLDSEESRQDAIDAGG